VRAPEATRAPAAECAGAGSDGAAPGGDTVDDDDDDDDDDGDDGDGDAMVPASAAAFGVFVADFEGRRDAMGTPHRLPPRRRKEARHFAPFGGCARSVDSSAGGR
jgi:hypothetical protein